MQVVNIHEAKTHLSKLVQRAASGEEIVIGRAGKPVARLVAFQPHGVTRRPGIWKGKVAIGPDFDDLPPELANAFQGYEP